MLDLLLYHVSAAPVCDGGCTAGLFLFLSRLSQANFLGVSSTSHGLLDVGNPPDNIAVSTSGCLSFYNSISSSVLLVMELYSAEGCHQITTQRRVPPPPPTPPPFPPHSPTISLPRMINQFDERNVCSPEACMLHLCNDSERAVGFVQRSLFITSFISLFGSSSREPAIMVNGDGPVIPVLNSTKRRMRVSVWLLHI